MNLSGCNPLCGAVEECVRWTMDGSSYSAPSSNNVALCVIFGYMVVFLRSHKTDTADKWASLLIVWMI